MANSKKIRERVLHIILQKKKIIKKKKTNEMKPKEIFAKPPHKIIISPRVDQRIYRSWKSIFLSEPSNSWLCDVPDEFILDNSNTIGLKDKINHFDICCDIITGKIKREHIDPQKLPEIDRNLPTCYGLLHARYIISEDGLKEMQKKYKLKIFGTCPRFSCNYEPLLPIGISSRFNTSQVKVFCPCCRKIYEPRPPVNIDGAFFGPNVAHILVDYLKIMDHSLRYRPYERVAFGFKVYDQRFDSNSSNNDQKQLPYSSALISPNSYI